MSKELSRRQRTSIEWTMLSSVMLCTLVVWMPASDPINLPKFVVLSLGASILAGLLFLELFQSFGRVNPAAVPILSLVLFMLVLFVSSMASDYRYMSFFGTHQRNNGFLSSLALAILFIAGATVFRINSAKKILACLAIVGGVEAAYGFVQHLGGDFLGWNNPYNNVIGTLGNPDFMSAVLGITSVALLWFVIDIEGRFWTRVSAAIGLFVAMLVIVFSQARQGLLAFTLGATVLLITWTYQRSRRLALGAGLVTLLGSLAGILGMLQIGPLSRFLYKPSITFRGDYWRAGFAIFKSHLILGVGPDRFGAYFRQYRDAKQVLRRGPDVTSDAAHSVVIQIAATGGVFALLVYLVLIGTIIWFGVRALRSAVGRRQLVVAAVFGAWVAYQVQSLISIDNLGIAVWGWTLGGVLVGLAQPEFAESFVAKTRKRVRTASQNRQQDWQLIGISLASLFAIISLILTGPMLGADVAMQSAMGLRPANNSAADLSALKAAILRAPDMRPSEPYYHVTAAQLLLQAGFVADARTLLKKDLRMDPRDYWAWYGLAISDEKANEQAAAVPARMRMAELDPFNSVNLLELGRDLKAAGDLAGAKAIIARIDSFAPNTPEAKSAQTELGG